MRWPWQPKADGEKPRERIEVALFPLSTPLLPDGRLPLKIFEARYLDLMGESLRQQRPFGICLIESGAEVAAPAGEPAVPHAVGTLATVESLDMREAGIMQVSVRGGRRFRIFDRRFGANQLQRAEVELLDEPACAIPDRFANLLPLLQQVLADVGQSRIPQPYRLDDAAWVGHRLVDVLPVKPLAKQKLLELNDPLERLEIVQKYLAQRGLVGS